MDGDMWDKEMVAEGIKVLTGPLLYRRPTPDGMIVRNTHSISFAKMGEDEFADFVRSCERRGDKRWWEWG